MDKRLITGATGALLLLLLLGAVAEACPTCKESLGGDPSTANMVRGYFWSILFMMSMPFLILSGLGAYFYYEICKARGQSGKSVAAGRRPTVMQPGE